jgi:iron complex transport system substrate-binding protein
MFRRTQLVWLLLVALAACGGASSSTTTPATTAGVPVTTAVPTTETTIAEAGPFPVTVAAANGSVTIATAPTAIVSLSPTGTEMLFAVGAGEQVVAVDEFSYYPAEAPVTDLSGFTPNIEAIADYEPDLVVVSDDLDGVVGALEGLGIAVLHLPAAQSMDDVYAQIETVGTATGHAAEAAELVATMQSELDSLIASMPGLAEPITFFHEIDNTLYTASSATFIGQVYAMLGLTNIADAVDTADSFGYPQLSAEYVIESDPDIIFLADGAYGESAETVAARPGWAELQAVLKGNIVAVDADVSSRWGPRIVDFVAVVVEAVTKAAAVDTP